MVSAWGQCSAKETLCVHLSPAPALHARGKQLEKCWDINKNPFPPKTTSREIKEEKESRCHRYRWCPEGPTQGALRHFGGFPKPAGWRDPRPGGHQASSEASLSGTWAGREVRLEEPSLIGIFRFSQWASQTLLTCTDRKNEKFQSLPF